MPYLVIQPPYSSPSPDAALDHPSKSSDIRGQSLSQVEEKQLRKKERLVDLLVLHYYYHTYAFLKSHCFLCSDAVLKQKCASLNPDPLNAFASRKCKTGHTVDILKFYSSTGCFWRSTEEDIDFSLVLLRGGVLGGSFLPPLICSRGGTGGGACLLLLTGGGGCFLTPPSASTSTSMFSFLSPASP
jgi:hypothetical protein